MFSNIQKKFSKNKLFFVILSVLFIFVNSTAFAASLNSECAPRVQRLIKEVKGTLFLRQPVNSCFHNTAALQFCKLQRRHLESEMYPRRIVRMHGAVYLRHKLT